jgi:hypothetical protein
MTNPVIARPVRPGPRPVTRRATTLAMRAAPVKQHLEPDTAAPARPVMSQAGIGYRRQS